MKTNIASCIEESRRQIAALEKEKRNIDLIHMPILERAILDCNRNLEIIKEVLCQYKYEEGGHQFFVFSDGSSIKE